MVENIWNDRRGNNFISPILLYESNGYQIYYQNRVVGGYNDRMDAVIIAQLLEINHQFYRKNGAEFSATRGRLQPGVQQILDRLEGWENILDLGCGNGELARQLAARKHSGSYTGLDFSPPLLEAAGKQSGLVVVNFLQADLCSLDWDSRLGAGRFDLVFAFAMLHHIPGRQLRVQILGKVAKLLKEQGNFIHSHWQFLNSPRLKKRIHPWRVVGMEPADLDPGDYLLDWRRGGFGLRYVHHFEQNELSDLAEASGFRVCESFLSDGLGGNLGAYQVWELTGHE
jgi:tRNA (uracil-5-)-methyltransferase TRM9